MRSQPAPGGTLSLLDSPTCAPFLTFPFFNLTVSACHPKRRCRTFSYCHRSFAQMFEDVSSSPFVRLSASSTLNFERFTTPLCQFIRQGGSLDLCIANATPPTDTAASANATPAANTATSANATPPANAAASANTFPPIKSPNGCPRWTVPLVPPFSIFPLYTPTSADALALPSSIPIQLAPKNTYYPRVTPEQYESRQL
ncbi:hypothetical protein BC827DRAFT_601464 [Russula dissimulans]|nr:hypothetical protein BC827DRAFT_601464 [Russula dissimulans]